jgi:cleavage and polyadenylation specificity factor subunit 2
MFTFTPLQGALSESTASQSLLELDGGVKLLIDVGWDETFDVEKLRELEKWVVNMGIGTSRVRETGSALLTASS